MPQQHADFELDPGGNVRSAARGAHPGSGRPAGYSPKDAANATGLDDPTLSEQTRRALRKAEATTSKAEFDALNAELKFNIDSGEYLSRSAFREAAATLIAELSHSLRSLPDVLERKANLPPASVVMVEKIVDGALSSIADGLELFTEQ